MNTSIAIRDKIHQFVDKADDRILRILEAILADDHHAPIGVILISKYCIMTPSLRILILNL